MDDRTRAKIEAAYLEGATVEEIAADTNASPYQVETYLRWWCDRGCPGADISDMEGRKGGRTRVTDGTAMSEQPLAFAGEVWTCAWCAAPINDSKIRHRDDCRWIEELIEYGIDLAEEARACD